jgi:hypothetical protein
MRVSYYFDRYNYVEADIVDVDSANKILTTTQSLYNGEHAIGNYSKIHGDIAIIKRIYDSVNNYTYEDYTFVKNKIYLKTGPAPTEGAVEVDYFYVPPTPALPTDLDTNVIIENWNTMIAEGNIRWGVEPWYELSAGDILTPLLVEFYRNEVIQHSSLGVDKLTEFDISRIDDDIIDSKGTKYRKGVDFYLRAFRDIVWIGNQPQVEDFITVRYGYHPTFRIYQANPVPNNLENKQYPKTFFAKLFNMTLPKDIERQENPTYPNLDLTKEKSDWVEL